MPDDMTPDGLRDWAQGMGRQWVALARFADAWQRDINEAQMLDHRLQLAEAKLVLIAIPEPIEEPIP